MHREILNRELELLSETTPAFLQSPSSTTTETPPSSASATQDSEGPKSSAESPAPVVPAAARCLSFGAIIQFLYPAPGNGVLPGETNLEMLLPHVSELMYFGPPPVHPSPLDEAPDKHEHHDSRPYAPEFDDEERE